MNQQDHNLDIFNKFHNLLAIEESDKQIVASLIYGLDSSNKKKIENSILIVDIARRNKNDLYPFYSSDKLKNDFFYKLVQKDRSQWGELEAWAAKAIMCAIKSFNKQKPLVSWFSETFSLGKIIPENASSLFADPFQKWNFETDRDFNDSPRSIRAAIDYFGKSENYNKFSLNKREHIAKKIINAAHKHSIFISNEWKENMIKKSAKDLKDLVKNLLNDGCEKDEILIAIKKSIKNKVLSSYLSDRLVAKSNDYPINQWDVVGNRLKNNDSRDHSRDYLIIKETSI